jgi:hypothetical protein
MTFPPARRFRPFRALLAIWAVVCCAGFLWLLRYANTPGKLLDANPVRPALAEERVPKLPELFLFLHPDCPCSEASVEEMAKLLAQFPDKVETQAVMVLPADTPATQEPGPLERHASHIPGVTVRRDPGGVEAKQLGAKTSGEAFLYDPNGALLFHGGITASRGHAGDNYGASSIASLLATGKTDRPVNPVFGCSLFDRSLR